MKERRPRTPRAPDSPEEREAAAIARVARAARAAARADARKADLKQAQSQAVPKPDMTQAGGHRDLPHRDPTELGLAGPVPPAPAVTDMAVTDPTVSATVTPDAVATSLPEAVSPEGGALESGPPTSPAVAVTADVRPDADPVMDSMTEPDGHAVSTPPPAALPDDPDGSEPSDLIPELTPMFPGAAPFLARFLPHSAPSHAGLTHHFCDLHAFLKYLHEGGWYGYLHAALGEQSAFVLLFEGRAVTAAAASATGEQALGELLSLYEQGASLSAHPLPADLTHVLSGVGSRAWKFNLTEDFTGLHARPTGAIYYLRGEIIATLPATLPYEGAFPAPLRPQTLILPRSLAGWAHHQYATTLRGRDATNAITGLHQTFRAQHGAAGLAFLRALSESLSPAEYALRSDVALHDLEAMVQDFVKNGYVREI